MDRSRAHEAITLLEVPNRFLSGVGEVALKSYYSDKTNWRKMLQNESESVFGMKNIIKH